MTPRRAIHDLANHAAHWMFLRSSHRPGTPGEWIQRQPEETRALLRDLRSEDVSDVAPWVIAWMCMK